ncbi:MAG: ROK family protein, partial [Thermoleophilia bacterium]
MADLRGGIDLGGTKIQTAIVSAGGEVLGEARHPTPTSGGPEDVAKAMEAALREAAAAADVEPSELQGVGVGSPGDADGKTGVV